MAGPTQVFSPHSACTQHLAVYVLKPNVAWALSASLDEKSTNMTIEDVAIGRDGEQQLLQARDEKIRAHDVLVMIGPSPYAQRFAERAGE